MSCYNTNDLKVCHDQSDESVYFDTPSNEVAYNVQIVRDNLNYWTVYHSEPKVSPSQTGDSIKVAGFNGSYTWIMPSQRIFRIWGTLNDPSSPLYTGNGVSGGGNPMTIAGRYWAPVPDPNYFVFFLAVFSDNGDQNNYRHHLLMARTTDFINFYIMGDDNQWHSFGQGRPKALRDINNQLIESNTGTGKYNTQGLIGSISQVNGVYYYFYVDSEPGNQNYHLYYQTTLDLNAPWSAPVQISPILPNPVGWILRVAKAKGMDRWAVLYNCYNSQTPDLCIQYTRNLNVIGSGGLSDLDYSSQAFVNATYALHLRGVNGVTSFFAQQYFMTDKDGNLISPDNDSQSYTRGGEITWMELPTNDVWPYGKKIGRAGWNIQVITTSTPTLTPTSSPTSTPTPTPLPIPGDLDKNNKVNISDYNILLQNFGNTTCGNVADIDGDCKVDIFDYNILMGNFGKTQ